MGSCYIGNHIVADNIDTDITTFDIHFDEPQQKYRLGTASNSLRKCVCRGGGGGGLMLNMFCWIQNPALCFRSGSKPLSRMKIYNKLCAICFNKLSVFNDRLTNDFLYRRT